jgi:hypothetical protein
MNRRSGETNTFTVVRHFPSSAFSGCRDSLLESKNPPAMMSRLASLLARIGKAGLLSLFTAVALAVCTSVASCQEGLQLVGAVMKAFQVADDAIDKINRLETALNDYQQGKKPSSSGDWSHLGDHFQMAAKQLKAIPLPDLKLAERPLISPKGGGCYPELVARSNQYLQDLRLMQADGTHSIDVLDDQILRAEKIREAVRRIAEIYNKMGAFPELGTVFQLDWADFEEFIPDAVSEYESAVKERRKAFEKQMKELNLRINNLQAMIALTRTACEDYLKKKAPPPPPKRIPCMSGNFHEGTTYNAGQLFWTLTFGPSSAHGVRSDNKVSLSLTPSGPNWIGSLNGMSIVIMPDLNCNVLSSSVSWFRLIRF